MIVISIKCGWWVWIFVLIDLDEIFIIIVFRFKVILSCKYCVFNFIVVGFSCC